MTIRLDARRHAHRPRAQVARSQLFTFLVSRKGAPGGRTVRAGDEGPSVPIIVEPLKEPTEVPAPPAPQEPVREPEKVPA
jgi:hypothetical protein